MRKHQESILKWARFRVPKDKKVQALLGEFWKLSYDAGGYGGLGDKPKLLEGSPQCRDNKVLIPFDGGITTCLRTGDEVAKERRVFA